MRALVLLLVLGCSETSEPKVASDPDSGAGIAVEIGVGREGFIALEQGATVRLQRGCQGLQHVLVALRAVGATGERATIDLALERAADREPVSARYASELAWETIDQDAHAIDGMTLVVPEPDLVLGKDAVLRAHIVDELGAIGESERTVRVQWGADDCRPGS